MAEANDTAPTRYPARPGEEVEVDLKQVLQTQEPTAVMAVNLATVSDRDLPLVYRITRHYLPRSFPMPNRSGSPG